MNLAGRIEAAQRDPEIVAAALALQSNRLDVAERSLKARLRDHPTDVVAIRMLSEVAGRIGRYADAERLLARALDLAPDFHAARANYVTVLHRQSKFPQAHAEADRLIAAEPDDYGHLALKAAVLVRTGGYGEAIQAYSRILARHPDQAQLWISYGHVLKTIGRQAESIAAYRTALRQNHSLGDAWWSLANLKTFSFTDEDIAMMETALLAASSTSDRYHLHFALGKAFEDRSCWARSFSHYADGNRLRRQELPYSADRTTAHLRQSVALLTRKAFEDRMGSGHPSEEPIFIVGLPRSGSTLLEQILASHTEVEGTMELPDIGTIAADLGGRGARPADADEHSGGYLSHLLSLSSDDRRVLGQRYLDGTRIQRKTGRRRFIDKMPNNFVHIGLIHLILPNAIIIDARRHPMGSGFSAFKQHFSRGQGFTYDLDDLGRYWRDYAALMDHYDRALPGRVYRVHHETLLDDTEEQIRALLTHCNLAFETACLRPDQNPRAVRTASSEQVRLPMTKSGLEHWRHYEPWLQPLRNAVGALADTYPET